MPTAQDTTWADTIRRARHGSPRSKTTSSPRGLPDSSSATMLPAKTSELARVHPIEYIEAIREASPRSGIAHLDPDTAMCPYTWDAALHAAGAAVLATDLVIGGRAGSAFCAVRPPGHHATR